MAPAKIPPRIKTSSNATATPPVDSSTRRRSWNRLRRASGTPRANRTRPHSGLDCLPGLLDGWAGSLASSALYSHASAAKGTASTSANGASTGSQAPPPSCAAQAVRAATRTTATAALPSNIVYICLLWLVDRWDRRLGVMVAMVMHLGRRRPGPGGLGGGRG